jgi:hypothetical protein
LRSDGHVVPARPQPHSHCRAARPLQRRVRPRPGR